MIEDGKATITIKELDELRKSDEVWKEHWKAHYEAKVNELKKKESILDKQKQVVESLAGKYLIATRSDSPWFRTTYEWLGGTEVFLEFTRDASDYFEDQTDKYLKEHTIFEIFKRKRDLK